MIIQEYEQIAIEICVEKSNLNVFDNKFIKGLIRVLLYKWVIGNIAHHAEGV
jgi:hypothetical protein